MRTLATLSLHVVICVVTVAFVLKANNLFIVWNLQDWESNVEEFAILGWELILVCWFYLGLGRFRLRRFLIATFAIFTAYAVYGVFAGHESCGCFGSLKAKPVTVLFLDATCLTVLLACKSDDSSARFSYCSFLGLAVSAAVSLALIRVATVEEKQLYQNPGSLFVLDASTWIDQRLPVLEFVDLAPEISQGRWFVVFYKRGCPDCERLLDSANSSEFKGSVAFIEVPPHREHTALQHSPARIYARLSSKRRWFGRLPLIIELRDSIVIETFPVDHVIVDE